MNNIIGMCATTHRMRALYSYCLHVIADRQQCLLCTNIDVVMITGLTSTIYYFDHDFEGTFSLFYFFFNVFVYCRCLIPMNPRHSVQMQVLFVLISHREFPKFKVDSFFIHFHSRWFWFFNLIKFDKLWVVDTIRIFRWCVCIWYDQKKTANIKLASNGST